MKFTRLNTVALMLVVLMFAIAAWFLPVLPDPVPTHWNAAGEVDGWTAKPWGVFLLPLITLCLLPLLLVLPVISPKGFRLDRARQVYDIVVFAVIAFMLLVQLFSFRAALGHGGDLTRAMPVLLGLLFIVLGNYLHHFPRNFFVGIRTPWTLASETVWKRTHRLGGYLFMAAGFLVVAAGLLGLPTAVWVAAIILAALAPALYSLIIYRSEHGFGPGDD
jgi:uncharacterized membrane protein